jgi:hypothetical protein
MTSIKADIVRNDRQIGSQAIPQAIGSSQGAQAEVVHGAWFDKPRIVYDVAPTDIEVAVHPLQRADIKS